MKHFFFVAVDNFYYNNRIFDIASPYNRDNAWDPYCQLKKNLEGLGYNVNTYDFLNNHKNYKLLFLDIPKNIKYYYPKNEVLKSYLVLSESDLILKKNWKRKKHHFFDRVFTWNDEWVDGKTYIKYFWPNMIPENFKSKFAPKNRFCTLIAGNKTNHDPRELYSKRIEAIRWFEKNHPEDFDFYGVGWEKGSYKSFFAFLSRCRLIEKGMTLFEKISIFQRLFRKSFSSYKGKVKSKKEMLEKYKFSICYENAKDIPGYITEKIFDCFLAGCVPVYWGAPNVTDFIPENSFIDKRKFKTYEDLYLFLKSMDEDTYLEYLKNIELFLNSEKGRLFSAENFVETVIKEIER
ncbi:MAG: hypothetical protein A2Y41_06530 [Spirochaetes bacterium GWB1_36_13]|nr:MAG: hypothetical protein A2Y41_06530 [Spirochaetes bacterium GWB1_36_13]